jgi:hypothetical protein
MPARHLALILGLLLGAATAAHASPNDLTVGALRTPTSKGGAALRAEPRIGAAVLGLVKHGTRFHVAEVRDLWIRVEAEVAAVGDQPAAKQNGWLRASETVEPYALTGEGRTAGVAGGTGSRTPSEVSAAGRGFTGDAEQKLLASQADLAAAMALLDARVEAVKPSPEAVTAFAKEGRLGVPGKTR